MERTRRAAAQPKIPGDLMEYARDLVDDRYSHIPRTANGRAMFTGFIMGAPGAGSAVVFISLSMKNLFTSAQEIYIDVSFKSRPRVPPTKKLMIIMAMYMNQAFPVAYALMTRKTEMAYTSVLEYIRACVPGIIASNIVTDYEVGLNNALTKIFPGVRLQRCWFHMAQALEEKAKYFGIQRQIYSTDNALHTMFHMSKALALLPADRIIEGFEVVVNEARFSPNIEVAQRYISYFQNQWMERVGPENFCIHGMPSRTKNHKEIFHRHLNTIIQSPRPGIWHFTETLIKIEREYGTIYERMQQRPILTLRSWAYLRLNIKISAACDGLVMSRISVREFLLYTGHCHLAYDAERIHKFGSIVNVHNGIIPPQIVKAIEEQILGENVENNVARGIEIRNLVEQQQRNPEQFPIQEVLNAPHVLEEQLMMGREPEAIAITPINNTIALPRQINCCICLGNQRTHACLPCGHKCLCSDCTDRISNQCPICKFLITNIVRIFD